MDGTSELLTIDEVLLINRRMIETSGGSFFQGDDNLLNPGSLEYTLEAAQGSFFGVELYPTTVKKAAFVCHRIIEGHVFHDGNKRTGLEACRQILERREYVLFIDASLKDIALQIASGTLSLEDFTEWLEQRVRTVI